ncbi:hypothetical protein K431DRAFT_121488 [Polychaeton citri CBS 116435]|uniref:Uncharacterized protein n=1 Tax=Polychaeton citri CBS 116435 TaxID=1314669 RepID=A0A9P4UKL0_9PEZI|nr:hypothetical protein K431DRAFT_121488 [Polychaeton citri CBS 116435]
MPCRLLPYLPIAVCQVVVVVTRARYLGIATIFGKRGFQSVNASLLRRECSGRSPSKFLGPSPRTAIQVLVCMTSPQVGLVLSSCSSRCARATLFVLSVPRVFLSLSPWDSILSRRAP